MESILAKSIEQEELIESFIVFYFSSRSSRDWPETPTTPEWTLKSNQSRSQNRRKDKERYKET